MTKFVPRVDPAVGFEIKFIAGIVEGDDAGDRYCNGKVDV
jgi:hypothetical protein